MRGPSGETLIWRRLRWRLRGAWQWPTFAVFLGLDSLALYLLPVAGDGPSPFAALLVAGFINLAILATLAPLGGRWLRRRRPDLPGVVASNYAGTGLVLAVAAVVLGLGLAHRPQLDARRHAFAVQSSAVRGYVLAYGWPAYGPNLNRADSWKLDENLYRTCVPGATPGRALCLFVDTSKSPPRLRRDPNPVANSLYFGPGGSGRPAG